MWNIVFHSSIVDRENRKTRCTWVGLVINDKPYHAEVYRDNRDQDNKEKGRRAALRKLLSQFNDRSFRREIWTKYLNGERSSK